MSHASRPGAAASIRISRRPSFTVMPLRQAALCPHDRRPGMVCLHCRHAERELARARRRTVAVRVGVLGGLLALLAGGAAAGADALQGRGTAAAHETAPAKRASTGASIAPKAIEAHAVPSSLASAGGQDAQLVARQAGAPLAGPASQGAAPVAAPVAMQGASMVVERAPVTPAVLAPAVPDGRTELGDSLFAVRTGDTVRVYFDTQETRTRRRDKFERIVRTTLPRVFGAPADTALAMVPEGTLANAGDLLSQLPSRGVRVALSAGRTLVLWPETRPGRDGPLVVSYRAVAGR